MQCRFFSIIILALLVHSGAQAELQTNCSDENTYLKINELEANSAGERVAEIFMNFKDLNRILNLPEVILHQVEDRLVINEASGNLNLYMNLIENTTELNLAPSHEAEVSIQLEGKNVREKTSLRCGK